MTLAHLLDRGHVDPRVGTWPPGAWLAEAAGTALLVFDALLAVAVTMAPSAPLHTLPMEARLLVVGLVVGGTVSLFAVTPAGKRSGAHLNPAVSLFMALRGMLSVRDALAYAVAQSAGSVAGVLAARLCWGRRMREVSDGLIQPGPGVGAVGVLIGETGSVVVLLLVLSWLVSAPRPRETPWVIGALIAALIVATGTTSGGSFNPARNFGPFVLGSNLHYFWTYLLAPMVAAVLTAAALRLTGGWSPRTGKLCGPALPRPSPADAAGDLRARVCRELERAGFTLHTGGPAGGVEVRECPAAHGGGLLLSWCPHADAFTPIDARVTQVEKAMAEALVRVLTALGFAAAALGESFSVRVGHAEQLPGSPVGTGTP